MDGFIERLRKRGCKLSKLERDVLEYIMANPADISVLSINELSAKLFISTATISRTAKKVGYEGYQELKYNIEQLNRESKKEILNYSSINTLIEKFGEQQKKEIDDATASLLGNNLDEIIKQVEIVESIEVMAVGASYPLAVELSQKLRGLGKNATARLDWDELRLTSKIMPMDALGILISQSGETLHILEYADNLVARNVPFIAIVGSYDSPLEKIAPYTLRTNSILNYKDEVDMSTRIGLSILINSLLLIIHHRE